MNKPYKHKKYNSSLQKLLFIPIKAKMREDNIKWKDLIRQMNESGFKCTKPTLNAVRYGNHNFVDSFTYFTKIYSVLGIPDDVTLSYLLECESNYSKLKPQRKNK